MSTVEQIDPTELGVLHRDANKTLMVAWINADLLLRCGHDVNRSVILYDASKMFEYAVHEVPDEALMQRLHDETPVKYWSKGI